MANEGEETDEAGNLLFDEDEKTKEGTKIFIIFTFWTKMTKNNDLYFWTKTGWSFHSGQKL